MAFTFKTTSDGNIEVFRDGERFTTTTLENARKSFGFTGDLTLPETQVQPAQTLPDTGQPSSNLLSFRDTLSKVTDLARNKRNESFLQFAMPFRGTTAASDFSSILSNLNRASERFTTEVTERLLPEEAPSRTQVVDIGGRKKLIDLTTGDVIRDLGETSKGVETPVNKKFTDNQIAEGVENSGMSFDEFEQLSIEDANEFIKGDKIGEPKLKEDIELILRIASERGIKEGEVLDDIRTLIIASGFDPDTFDEEKYKRKERFFKTFEQFKAQFTF